MVEGRDEKWARIPGGMTRSPAAGDPDYLGDQVAMVLRRGDLCMCCKRNRGEIKEEQRYKEINLGDSASTYL